MTTRRRAQRGATMIEFSLVLPVVLILIFFAVDGFIAASRYSRLTYAVSELSRRVSVQVGIAALADDDCGVLTELADDRGQAWIVGALESLVGTNSEITFRVQTGEPYPFLTVSGNVQNGCVFCRFLPAGALSTSATLAIERELGNC
jgi:Tfp pilus assembly protein FimT